MDKKQLDEINEVLSSNPNLLNVIHQYVTIANGNTKSKDANDIEYDICDISQELNVETLKLWIAKQQQNAEIALAIQGDTKKSGKKK